jgi:hypothetical protein
MKNPEALAAAHKEIDAAAAAGSLSSPIKYSETTTKLPYICAAIKEAMRMHPSVGLSMQRHAPEEGLELAGKFIPRGYRVGLNPAVVHYDKSVFGQDADEFKPERWLVGNDEWKAMDRNLLIFGAGTRTCIGKNVSHRGETRMGKSFQVADDRRSRWLSCIRWFPNFFDISTWRWRMTGPGKRVTGGFTNRPMLSSK